jgi:hypothetical protein
VKGAATLDTNSDSDHEADKSDHNLNIESDTDTEIISHPIEDEKELGAEFRQFYLGANNDIKELIRRLSPQEKEERMQKGLCLYCGEPGHVIANCMQIQQKERGRAIREPDEDEIWSYEDDPLNWEAIQQEEQC